MMQYRPFGKTSLVVSELGLACPSIGGGLYHRDDHESLRMLHQALDGGVTFYDVSDHHSQGHAEELLGQAFRGRRRQVVIATKGGYLFSPTGTLAMRARFLARPLGALLRPLQRTLHRMKTAQVRHDFSPAYLQRALEASLRRLQTDYIDLYQLYKPSKAAVEAGEFIPMLEQLKAQGKIRYYGVACATVKETMPALEHSGISSVQVAVNLLDQDAIPTLIPRAQQQQVAVVARYPRASGLLTTAGEDLLADNSRFSQEEYAARRRRAQAFQFLANERRTLAQAALQFVLQLPGIASVVPRAVTRSELAEHLGALSAPPLTAEELRRIHAMNGSAALQVAG